MEGYVGFIILSLLGLAFLVAIVGWAVEYWWYSG